MLNAEGNMNKANKNPRKTNSAAKKNAYIGFCLRLSILIRSMFMYIILFCLNKLISSKTRIYYAH